MVGLCRMLVSMEVVYWLCAVLLVLWVAIHALACGIVCLECIVVHGVSINHPSSLIGCNGSAEMVK